MSSFCAGAAYGLPQPNRATLLGLGRIAAAEKGAHRAPAPPDRPDFVSIQPAELLKELNVWDYLLLIRRDGVAVVVRHVQCGIAGLRVLDGRRHGRRDLRIQEADLGVLNSGELKLRLGNDPRLPATAARLSTRATPRPARGDGGLVGQIVKIKSHVFNNFKCESPAELYRLALVGAIGGLLTSAMSYSRSNSSHPDSNTN